jgi:hypothetical protein
MANCTIITGFIPELVPIPQDVNVYLSNELGQVNAGLFHVKGTGLLVEGDSELFGALHVHDSDAFFDKNVTIYGGDLSVQSGSLFLNAGDYYINGIPLRSTIANDPNSIVKSGLSLDLDASKLDSYHGTGAQWYDQSYYENDLSFVSTGQMAEFHVNQFIVDETGDFGRIEDSSSIRPEVFTFGMYFNPTQEGHREGNFVAGKLTKGNDTSYGFHYYNSGRLVHRIRFDDSASEVAVDDIHWSGWHYVTAKWDGTTHSIYANGKYITGDSSQAGAAISYNDQPFLVGYNTGETHTHNHFTGNIESVHLYEGVLPDFEIRKNFLKTSTLTLHKDVNISGGLYVNGKNVLDFESGINVFVEDGGNASVTGDTIKNIDVSSAGVQITGGVIEQLTYSTNVNNPAGDITVDGGTNDVITLNIDDSNQQLSVNNVGIGSTVLMRNYHGSNIIADITGYLFVIEPGSQNTVYNLNRAFIDRNSGVLNIWNSGGSVDISGDNYISNYGGILNVSGNITGNINISGGINTIDLDEAGVFQVIGGQQTIANSGLVHISGGSNYITGGNINATGAAFSIWSGTTHVNTVDPVYIEQSNAVISDSVVSVSGSDSSFIVSFGTGTLDVTHSSILITDYVSGDEPAPVYTTIENNIEEGGHYSPSFSNGNYGYQENYITIYSGVQFVNRDLLTTNINVLNNASGSSVPINITGGVNALHAKTGGYLIVTGGVNTMTVDDSYLGKSDINVWYGDNTITSNGTMTAYITGSGIFMGTMNPTTANIDIHPYAIFQGDAVLSTANITSHTGIVTFNSGSECTTLNIGDENGYGTYSTYITGDQTINLTLSNSYINELNTAYINGADQNVSISDASVVYAYDSTNTISTEYDLELNATGGISYVDARDAYEVNLTVNNPSLAHVTGDIIHIHSSTGIDINEQVNTITITGSENINITSGNQTIQNSSGVTIGAYGNFSRVLNTAINDSVVSLSGSRNYIYDSVNTITTDYLDIFNGVNSPSVYGAMNVYTGTVDITNPIQGELNITSGVDTQVHNSGVVNFYANTSAENVFGGIVNITNSDITTFEGSGASVNMYDPSIGIAYQSLHFTPTDNTGIYVVRGDFSHPSSGFVVYTQQNLITGNVVDIYHGNNWLDFSNFSNTGSGNLVNIFGVSGATTNNYISGSELITLSGDGNYVSVYNSNASGNVPHILQFSDGSIVTVDNTNSNGTALVTGFGQAIIAGGLTNVTGNLVIISGGTNVLQNDFSGEITISGGLNLVDLSGELTINHGTNFVTGLSTVTINQNPESGGNANTYVYGATEANVTGMAPNISFSGYTGSSTVNVTSDTSYFFDSTVDIGTGGFAISGGTTTIGSATDVTVNQGTTTLNNPSNPIINSPSSNVVYGGFNTLPTGTIYYGNNTIEGDVGLINLSGEGTATITHDGGNLDVIGGNVSIYGSGDNRISGSTVFIHGGENLITGDDIFFNSGASANLVASGNITVTNAHNVYISGLSTGDILVYDNDLVTITGIVNSVTGVNISIVGLSGGHTVVNTPSSPYITGGLNFVNLSGDDFIFLGVESPIISGSTVNMTDVEMATITNGTTNFTGTVSGIVNGENVTMTFVSGMGVDVTATNNTILNYSGQVNVGDYPSIYHGIVPIYSGTQIDIDRNSTITAYDSSFVADNVYSASVYSGTAFFTGVDTNLTAQLNNSIGHIYIETGQTVDVVSYNTSTVNLHHTGSGAFINAYDDTTINISGCINDIYSGPVEIKLGVNYVYSTGVTTQAGHNEITTDDCDILQGFNYFYNFTGNAEISGLYNFFYDSECSYISGYLNRFFNGNNHIILDDRDTFNTTNHITAFVDKSGDFHYVSITGSGNTINVTGNELAEINDYSQYINRNDIFAIARSGTFVTITGNNTTNNITGAGDVEVRNFTVTNRTFTTVGKSGTFIDVSGNDNIVTGSGQTTINDYSNRYVTRSSIDKSGIFIDVNGNENIVTGSGQTTINDYSNRYTTVNLIEETGTYITVNGNENIVTGSGQTTIKDYSNRYTTVNLIDETGVYITVSGDNNIITGSGQTTIKDYSTKTTTTTVVEKSGTFDYSTTENYNTFFDNTGTYITISGDNNATIRVLDGDAYVYNGGFVEKSGVFITVSGDNNTITGSGQTTIYDYSSNVTYDVDKTGIFITVTGDNVTVTGSGQTTINDYSSSYSYTDVYEIEKSGEFYSITGDSNVLTFTGSGITVNDYSSKTTNVYEVDKTGEFYSITGDGNSLTFTGSGITVNDYTRNTTNVYQIDRSGSFVTITGTNQTFTITGSTGITVEDNRQQITNVYQIEKSGTFMTVTGSGHSVSVTGTGITLNDYSYHPYFDQTITEITQTNTYNNVLKIDKTGDFSYYSITGSGNTFHFTGSGITVNDYSQEINYVTATNIFDVRISGGYNTFSGADDVYVTGARNLSTNIIYDSDVHIYNALNDISITGGNQYFTGENVNIYDGNAYFTNLSGGIVNVEDSDVQILNSGIVDVTGSDVTVFNGPYTNPGEYIYTGYFITGAGNTLINVSGTTSIVNITGEVTVSGGKNSISDSEVNIYEGTNSLSGNESIYLTGTADLYGELGIYGNDNYFFPQDGSVVNVDTGIAHISGGLVHIGSGIASGASPTFTIGITGSTVAINSGCENSIYDSVANIFTNTATLSGGVNNVFSQTVGLDGGVNTMVVSGDVRAITGGVNTITTDNVNSVTGGVNTFNILHSGYVNLMSGQDTNIYATGNELTDIKLYITGNTFEAGSSNAGTNNITATSQAGGTTNIDVDLASHDNAATHHHLIDTFNANYSNVYLTGSQNINAGTISQAHNTFNTVSLGGTNAFSSLTAYGPSVHESGLVTGDVELNTVRNLVIGITNGPLNVTITGSGTGYFTGPYASGSVGITGTVNNLSVTGGHVTLNSNTLTSNVDVDESSVEINHYTGGNTNYINTSTVTIISGHTNITGGEITVQESINDIEVNIASGSDASLTLTNSTNYISGGVSHISGSAYITGGINYISGGAGFVATLSSGLNNTIHSYGGDITINNKPTITGNTVTGSGSISVEEGDIFIYHSGDGHNLTINSGEVTITGTNSQIDIHGGDNYLYMPTGTYVYGDITNWQSTGTIESISQAGTDHSIGTLNHTGNIGDFDIDLISGTIGTIQLSSYLDLTDTIITGSGNNIYSESNIDNFYVNNSEITNIFLGSGILDIDTGIIGNVYLTGTSTGDFDIDYQSGDLTVNAFQNYENTQSSYATSSYYGGGAVATTSASADQEVGAIRLDIGSHVGDSTIDLSTYYSSTASPAGGYASNNSSSQVFTKDNSPVTVDIVLESGSDLFLNANFTNSISQSTSSYYGSTNTFTNTGNVYQVSITGDGIVHITGSDGIHIYDADTISITGTANITGSNPIISGSTVYAYDSNLDLAKTTNAIFVTGGHNEIYTRAQNIFTGATTVSGHYIEEGGFINITGNVENLYSGVTINQIFSGTQYATGIIENVIITGGINDLEGDNLTLYAAYIGTLRNTDNSVTTGSFVTTGNTVTGSGVLNVYNTLNKSTNNTVNLTGDHSHVNTVISGTVNVNSDAITSLRITGGVNAISGGDDQIVNISGGDNTIDGGTATIIGDIANLTLKDSVNTVTGGTIQVDGGINDITGHYVGITGGTNYINHNQDIDNIDAYGGTFHLQYNTGVTVTGTDFTVNITDGTTSITGQNNAINLTTSVLNATQTDGDIFVYESTVTANDFSNLNITGGLNTNYIDNRSGVANIDNSLLQTVDASSSSVIKNYLTQVTTITGGTTYITGNVTGKLIETANIYTGTTNIPVYASDGIGSITINSGLTNLDYATGVNIYQGSNNIHDSDVILQGDSSNIYITGGINTFTGRNIDISGGINYVTLSGEDVLLYNSTMVVTGGSISYVSGHDIDIYHGTTNITDHPNEINVWYTQTDGTSNDARVIISGGLTNVYQFRNIEKHSGAFTDINHIGPESLHYQYNTHTSNSYHYGYAGSATSYQYNNPSITGSVHNVTGVSNTTNISGGVVNIYNAPRVHADYRDNTFSAVGYYSQSNFSPTFSSTISDNEFTNTNTIHNSTVTITGTYDNIGQTNFDSGNTVNIYIDGAVHLEQPTGNIIGNVSSMTFTGINKQLNVSGSVQIIDAHEIVLQNFNDAQNVDSNVSVIDSNIGGSVNVYGGLTQVLGTNPVTFNLTTGDLAANTIIHHGQLSHGFAIGDVIRYEQQPVVSPGVPAISGYVKACANNISTSTPLGVVKSVLGSSFEYVSHGQIPYITGYTAGQPLYLSDVTSGQLTEVAPSSFGSSVVEVAQVVNGGHLIVSPHFSGTHIFPQNTGANIYPTKYVGSTAFGNSDTFYRDHLMAETVMMTKKIDLTQTGKHVIHMSPEGYFYADEAGLLITESTNPVLTGPEFMMGYSGDLEGYTDKNAIDAITEGQRERYLALNDTKATDHMIVTISSGATAGALEGKFYFKGFLTQDS